jgi:hypothetical protein
MVGEELELSNSNVCISKNQRMHARSDLKMVLAIDGSAINASTTNAASISASLTTTQANDVIVVAFMGEMNTNAACPTISQISSTHLPSTAWSKRSQIQMAGEGGTTSGNIDVEVWWAVASSALSSESITVTLTGTCNDDMALVIFGVSGANTSSPWDSNSSLPAYNTNASSTSKNIASTTFSTSNANDILLSIQGVEVGAGATPSGYTEVNTANNSGGTYGAIIYVAEDIVTATQSSVSQSTTESTDWWGVIADAIQQAPVPPLTFATHWLW